MINERIQKYINDYAFCSEYLFKDWESFLDLLYAEGGRISSILWWDYCTKKQLKESVRSGGYKDPDNDGFVYAETQLYKEGLETYTLDEIKEYINQERNTGFRYGNKYKSHELVPSFHLVEFENEDNSRFLDNIMTQKILFDSGFPHAVRNEYEYVISLISKVGKDSVECTHSYNSDREIYVLSDGAQIKFPYRIYCLDDDFEYSRLADNEKLVYDCIFTRSYNGHVREKHIRNLMMIDLPEWCFPYIVRSSSDYVLEIVNAIYEELKLRDNNQLKDFCKNNLEIVQTNFRRMCSYWNEYYRRDFPEFTTYAGTKLFSECLMLNSSSYN